MSALKDVERADLVVVGAGCAGLSLAVRLLEGGFRGSLVLLAGAARGTRGAAKRLGAAA